MKLLGLSVLCLLAALLLSTLWSPDSFEDVDGSHPSSRTKQAAPSSASPVNPGIEAPSIARESVTDRSSLEPENVQLTVLDQAGVPVQGALVSLTTPTRADEWRRLDVAGRLTTSPHAFIEETDAWGQVKLPSPTGASAKGPIFLWVTHAEYQGQWLDYSTGAAPESSNMTVSLGPPRNLHARLEDRALERGGPIWIVQTLSSDESTGGGSPGLSDRHSIENGARRSLIRMTEVGALGDCELPQFEYESFAQAIGTHAQSSLRIVVPERQELLLSLLSTFFIRGRVLCDGLPNEGEAILAVYSTVGHSRDVLSEHIVRMNSSFGPLEVPLPSTGRLFASASSPCGGTVPIALGTVAAGETVLTEFLGTSSPDSWFQVQDAQARPVSWASVIASWPTAGTWVERSGVTDADGYCKIAGIGGETVQVTIRHGSLASRTQLYCSAHRPREEPQLIVLERGRDILGSVRLEGAPATDFTIFAWNEDPQGALSFSFRDRKHGNFDLPRVSTSELHVLAAGPGMSSSPILTIPAGDASVDGIQLHCQSASRLQLQVFDSSTGDPIAGAVVSQSPYAMQVGLPSVSTELVTDAQGFASFEDFSCSETVLYVEHEDYSERSMVFSSVPPETDRGVVRVAMDGMRNLTISLKPWPSNEWETAWVQISGSTETEFEEVDSSGSRRFDSVAIGPLNACVVFPDSTTVLWEGYLFPGSDDLIVIDLESENHLDVSLTGHPDDEGERLICEYVSVRDDAPAFSLRTLMNDRRKARLNGLPEGTGLIRISFESGAEIAEKVITAGILASGEVTLEATTHEIDVLVRQSDGTPAAGIYVYAAPDHAPFQLYDWAMTNAVGEASIERSGASPSSVIAAIGAKVTSVRRFDPTIDDEDALELKFIEPVEVQFSAPGAGPASVEVQGHLNVTKPRLWIAEISTSVPHMVSPGTYTLVLKTPGLWLDQPSIRIPEAGGSVEIEVRRLGVLSVSPLGTDGIGLADVELTDAKNGESSDVRLAHGKISRITTEDGALEFRGLPCGTYQYHARFADGLVRTGSVQVAPDTRTTLEIARE
ncbi:MAG: hypothetical protein H6831_00835 [Planctomycetes bacterium]|nr:hypothetical protein [Planctomycetota bacterium]